jgi:type II secretory pathway pseudopilin PulG
MYLEGQAGQRGYAMAAVLMSVAVMAIVMSALLPVWRQQMQREKEAELAFRGEQYARAIYLFQRSNGGQNPPSLDVLVSGRYIRKKYKDPMTEDGEFLPLSVGANQPGMPGGPAGQRGAGPGSQRGGAPGIGATIGSAGGSQPTGSGRGGSQPTGLGRGGGQPSPGLGGSQPTGGVQGGGGIITVVSKSKEASIRIYNGASHYNEWRFLYNARGRGAPGREGGPGGGPTQGRPGVGAPGQGGRGPAGPGRSGAPSRGGGPGRGLSSGGRGQ